MFEPPLDLNGARILLVNDGLIRAPGLKALEQIAKSQNHSRKTYGFSRRRKSKAGQGTHFRSTNLFGSAASQPVDLPSVAVRPIA